MAAKRHQPFRYDLDRRTVTFRTRGGEEMTVCLNGLAVEVIDQLALTGAAVLTSRRSDGAKGWSEISKGNIGKRSRRHYPSIVKALTEMRQELGERVSLDRTLADWAELSEEQQEALRADPKVRYHLALMRAREMDVPEESAFDQVFGRQELAEAG